MKVAILAAGRSSRIYEKIQKNKCLIDINGEPLINNLINKLINTKKVKEEDIYIVTGFKSNLIRSNVKKKFKKINYIYNKYFQKREMLYSMLLAMKKINEDFKQKLINKIPSGNLGSGEDVSNCVAFLASDWSNYINGETIHVNGGMYMS